MSRRSPTRRNFDEPHFDSSSELTRGPPSERAPSADSSRPGTASKMVRGARGALRSGGEGLRNIATTTVKGGASVLGDYKSFISRGNIIDLAVGIVMGAAFTNIVNSLVKDIVTPLIGLAGGRNFENMFIVLKEGTGKNGTSYATVEEAQKDKAVTMNYGIFLTSIITFLITATCMFFLTRSIVLLRRQKPASSTERECPYCRKKIDKQASKCPFCISDVEPVVDPIDPENAA